MSNKTWKFVVESFSPGRGGHLRRLQTSRAAAIEITFDRSQRTIVVRTHPLILSGR